MKNNKNVIIQKLNIKKISEHLMNTRGSNCGPRSSGREPLLRTTALISKTWNTLGPKSCWKPLELSLVEKSMKCKNLSNEQSFGFSDVFLWAGSDCQTHSAKLYFNIEPDFWSPKYYPSIKPHQFKGDVILRWWLNIRSLV